MTTEVIQPAPGQTVITTDHRHHDRHDDRGRHFSDIDARADYRSIVDGHRALTNEVERFGTANLASAARTNEIVQAAACRTDQLVQGGFGDTSDRICSSAKDVTGAITVASTAAALAACKTQDEVAAVYASLQKQVSDAATATVVGFKDAQATAYQIEGRTALDAAKNVATLGLQATTNANAISVEATKNFYALTVEATKNADAAQLEAQKNAAAVAMQIAECCCELKALVTSDGNTTRALINTNTIEQLRAQLVATQRLIPVTIPVGAG